MLFSKRLLVISSAPEEDKEERFFGIYTVGTQSRLSRDRVYRASSVHGHQIRCGLFLRAAYR